MTEEKKSRILVVEDDRSVLTTYRMLLERQGYEVVSVTSYDGAEKSLQKGNFDLLICDLSLEKQHSAFEVIEVARRLDQHMAAVVVTGYASPEEMERAKENHIRVLLKPIEIEEFLSTISNALPKPYANNQKAKLENA